MSDEAIIHPELEGYIAQRYDIAMPPGSCKLIRRGFNHTYLVCAPPDKYVFRIYLNRKYYIGSPDDFQFELEWLRFLHGESVSVAHPVPDRAGQLLGEIELPSEEARACALFTFAHGEQKDSIANSEAVELGRTLARLHTASTRFYSHGSRYHFNLEYLTEQPLNQIDQFLREQGREGAAPYLPRVAELEAPIRCIPITPETYGLIHGDLHLGNMHFNSAGEPTLFDFDHSGYGWRAYDLATCLVDMPEAVSAALLSAYHDIRPLLPEERESIPAFQQIRPIWDIGDVLAMRTAWQNHAKFGADFADKIERRLKDL